MTTRLRRIDFEHGTRLYLHQPQVIQLDTRYHQGPMRHRTPDLADYVTVGGFFVVTGVLLVCCFIGMGVLVVSVWHFVRGLIGG